MKVLNYVKGFVSCGHRYARSDWSREKNLQVYGGDDFEKNLGHNLEVWVCRRGPIHWAQEDLGRLCDTLDHQFLNEIMEGVVPTTEAVARYCFEKVKSEELEFIRVQEGDHLWAEFSSDQGASLTKAYQLNCLHRHYNSHLSERENRELYGKCSQVHGHEYRLEITLRGRLTARVS